MEIVDARTRIIDNGGAYTAEDSTVRPFPFIVVNRPLGLCGVSNHTVNRGGFGVPRTEGQA